MNSLIISLTTIHSRIGKVHHVIRSLLEQNTSEDFGVRLYLSAEPYLLDEGVKEVPFEIRKMEEDSNGKFKIIYTDNIGPYRKFLPLLRDYFQDKIDFEYFVTVDDDTLYPDDWLQRLIDKNKEFDCVVAYRGRQITCDERKIEIYKRWKHSTDEMSIPSIKTVGTGKDGIIYRPHYFHPDVIDIEKALEVCNHADDLWLKFHTAINGVPSVLLSSTLSDAFQDLGEADDNTLYRKINKYGGNDTAVLNLTNYFLERYNLNVLNVLNLDLSQSSTWLNQKFLNSYFV